MSCPENFEEIPHTGAPPFAVLRTPHKSIVLSLYEVSGQPEGEGTMVIGHMHAKINEWERSKNRFLSMSIIMV